MNESIDGAWREAEAALPEGWLLSLVSRAGQYMAEAWEDDEAYASGEATYEVHADTPAAALLAIAARLSEPTT